MNDKHIAQAEIGRALAAAEVFFGYRMTLEHLQKVISGMGVTLETREEVDYLVRVHRGHVADLGVLINVADSLTDKFETGRLEVAKGFGWLEQAGRNLNDAAKVAIGWAVVVVLQVLAGCILYNVAFDRVPTFEFWFFAAALVLFVGNSAVIACWAFSMGDTMRIPRHSDTQPTLIRTPVPRSFGQAVGAQRRRGGIVSLRCPASSISASVCALIHPSD